MSGEPVVRLKDLRVTFSTDDGDVHAVRGVTLDVPAGSVVAIVGESGSGKSVTALSVLQLHPKGRTTIEGAIDFGDEDLLRVSDRRMREVRGAEISMVFQDPLTALNPVYKVGKQIAEVVRQHTNASPAEAMRRAIEMLGLVGIPQPERRARMYPHEFSGGMRQRVMIALALALEPSLVIADEPTTALDVTVQAQVLDLLRARAQDMNAAILLITHDLGVVAGMADAIAVMYAGKIVERGTTEEIFGRPSHPYTVGLLASLPSLDDPSTGELHSIGGQPPSMLSPPSGCSFHPRCPYAEDRCRSEMPELRQVGTHDVACLRADEIADQLADAGARR